jgi:NAD(P)-dependent dehydrogenase (short-subunit alcohol dehydrogenase family)
VHLKCASDVHMGVCQLILSVRIPNCYKCQRLHTIMNKLDGKIAVITGGSSGIGLATAQRFVDEGAHVFITGRRQKELDQAVTQIGKSVTGVQGDVSKLDDLDRLYDKVKEQKGKIDVLFANAGIMQSYT